MKSVRITAFLSCSFQKADQSVVQFFHGIARGLDIDCVNVNKAYSATPPESARKLIADSTVLIAVATQREKTADGKFNMPKAVSEELSMAFALQKPILLLKEEDVDVEDGFVKNYSTFLEFNRALLTDSGFLEKAVASIHQLKVAAITSREVFADQQGAYEFYAEHSTILIELKPRAGGFLWQHAISRRLVFSSRFSGEIKAGSWAAVPATNVDPACTIQWKCRFDGGSKAFTLKPSADRLSAHACELSIAIDPTPEPGDVLEYSLDFESPYLNPIWEDEVDPKMAAVTIAGKRYSCLDGVDPNINIRDCKIQFRFPREYGMTKNDFCPFAGCLTSRVDYIIESETRRMQVETDSFGGDVVITCQIESPLPQHVYGLAWNPPSRKKPNQASDATSEPAPGAVSSAHQG
jgi:hypothetical protein